MPLYFHEPIQGMPNNVINRNCAYIILKSAFHLSFADGIGASIALSASVWRDSSPPDNFFALTRVRTGQRSVLGSGSDGPHREPEAAVATVHAVVVRIEQEAPRVARVVGLERTRPVVAGAARVAELAVVAAACSGQEERLSVPLRGKLPAGHAVPYCPLVGGVL